MPTYEYECENCGYDFETIQKISDTPLKTCPQCGGALHKVITSFGVEFKGSGFYINDSKSSSSRQVNKGTSCSKKSCTSCSSGCKNR